MMFERFYFYSLMSLFVFVVGFFLRDQCEEDEIAKRYLRKTVWILVKNKRLLLAIFPRDYLCELEL
jgi:hypothetical protein